MKIQTVNQLISVFKDISTRHYQINGFGIGDDWENGASEAKMHPVLWINPTTATMPSSDNGYKTFEIDFEVRVFDLVNKDESNENEVLSDCIDILKDIITEFKGHPYYVNSQLNIIDDINFEAFTEEFDEEVSGWVCEISLMTPVLTSFCGIPSADITGFEFPGADCPEVNVLCPVFVEDVTGVYPIVVTTTGTTKEVSLAGGVGSDTYVISGEYDNGTLTLTRNDDVDVIVTGFDTGGDNDYTTSATLSGNIITFDRTDTVGAYSVDLTSAINSAPDKFVSSGAFDDSSKLLTLTLNDATDFNVDFSTLTTADKFVSSGAYDSINNKIVLTLNDASTVDIDTSAIGGGDSIYTADGTLTGDRTVDLGSNDLGINGSGLFSISNGTRSISTTWNTHTIFNLNNGNGTTYSLYSGNNSSTFDAGQFGIGVGSNIPFRIFNGSSVALGNVGKGSLDTNYKVQTAGATLIGGNLDTKLGTNEISLDHTNYPKLKISNGTTEYWLIEGDGTGSTFASGDLYLYDATNGDKRITFKQNNGGTIIGSDQLISTEDISLQGSTLIKGIGTAGSSALTIYDNDTTPNKVFEVLDDSTIKTNGNAGFTGTGAYTNFTIENGIITNAS